MGQNQHALTKNALHGLCKIIHQSFTFNSWMLKPLRKTTAMINKDLKANKIRRLFFSINSLFLIGRTSKQAKHNLHTKYQPQIIKPHVVLVDTSLSKNHGIAERLMLYIVTTLTTDLLHVQCKEILLVLITVGPSVQTWIFISFCIIHV